MSERNPTYLAFDMGATSWRAALGREEGGRLGIEEIHRENHQPIEREGGLFWDADGIFQGMKRVLKDVAQRGIELSSIGIDSWSVDYGLLDEDGCLLEAPRCYRDQRNEGMAEEAIAREVANVRRCCEKPGQSSKQPEDTSCMVKAYSASGTGH